MRQYRRRITLALKRAFDVLVSCALLLALSRVIALVALLVRLALGSPILFRQAHPGLHGRAFTLLKFRTMTDARDEQGNLLANVRRVFPVGRFLRSTSLDELPELLNVPRREMSLVWPRPLLMRYPPCFSELERKRFEVLPSITGWA